MGFAKVFESYAARCGGNGVSLRAMEDAAKQFVAHHQRKKEAAQALPSKFLSRKGPCTSTVYAICFVYSSGVITAYNYSAGAWALAASFSRVQAVSTPAATKAATQRSIS